MKIAGIALIWVGALALLKNLGVIPVIDWNIIWPVVLIIAGTSLKHFKRSVMCGFGGKCKMCASGKGDDHKCEEGECGMCKK